MSYYPEKYRKRTIEYRQEGHTLKETSQTFKVSVSAIQKWEKILKETGNLKKKLVRRRAKKIDPERLKLYIEEHPDAYQKEIAEEFQCTATAICKALKRLGITRKKRQNVTRNKRQKK